MRISYEMTQRIAQLLEQELKDFRLSGDLVDLQHILQAAVNFIEAADFNSFYKDLTANEKMAYEAVAQIVPEGGYISITKMTQQTKLSRPVFDSLLNKMEKYNIADIKSCGVKGTKIEWRIKL